MSRRTAAADKAIRIAWEKERELVSKGQGTRNWTPEQQKTILDPERGKAYDDNEVPFQGQHMKSVEKYPEYQGDSDNIQFLSRKEHLEAHKGSWQNPTNWYYDPVEKQFFDFGDGAPIPCVVITLSNPVICVDNSNVDAAADDDIQEKETPSSGTDPPIVKVQSPVVTDTILPDSATNANINHVPKANVVISISNSIRKFSNNHPVVTVVVKAVAGVAVTYVTGKTIRAIARTGKTGIVDPISLLDQVCEAAEQVGDVVSEINIKNAESIIKNFGYSVSKRVGLSDAERQQILKDIISGGKMLKEAICAYLEFNINLHKNQSTHADAVDKWVADLAFVKNL